MNTHVLAPSDSKRGGDTPNSPGRLVVLTSQICKLLDLASRSSWLDRGVYGQTKHVHELLLDLAKDGPVHLEFARDRISLGDEELTNLPRGAQLWLAMVRRKRIASIQLSPEMTLKEVMVLNQIFLSKGTLIEGSDRAHLHGIKLFEGTGEDQIEMPQILTTSRLGEKLDVPDEQSNEIRVMVADITKAIDDISPEKRSAAGAKRGKSLGIMSMMGDLGGAAEVTLILASLRRHDAYTYDHSINVGLLSIALARAIGWKGTDLHEFGVAALIHDIGKIYTPLEVLNKPGRFTPAEWVIMKKHPRDGYEILLESALHNKMAPRIALEHHISHDGTGYPVIPFDEPLLGSNIVKIADVYDAFTTIRPYRSQSRPVEVMKMLKKQAGTQFRPELVEAFVDMMGDYPIGTTVKLASGYIGLVVETSLEHKDRPIVRVLQHENGRRPKELKFIDLAAKDDKGKFSDDVIEAIDPVIRNIPIGRYI